MKLKLKTVFIFGGIMDKYKTRQSATVTKCLEENCEKALTVDEIVDLLKNQGTPVGKTTVYRHIDRLVSQGSVRKFSDEGSSGATYQYVHDHHHCSEHFHLKCSSCGELVHLGCEFMKGIDEHILSHHGFRVDNSKTVLYGICKSCSDKENI